MPLSKAEWVKWKSELIIYLSIPYGSYFDNRGFLRVRYHTKKYIADRLHVYPVTVSRWFSRKSISPHFQRELIRLKIVRKEYV